MEIFELRYFLGVARTENLQRAAESLAVSPASLSKTVKRLEDELSVKLFLREGRNIRLTDHGRLLQKKAAELVGLEESARIEVGGVAKGAIRAVLAGPEVLLAGEGVARSLELRRLYPGSSVELLHCSEEEALERVERGEAHLALVTRDAPGLSGRVVAETAFLTFCGRGHPLFAAAKAGRTIPVEEVLTHPFASPSHSFLGQVGGRQSLDGWRDDKFPRQVGFLSSSLRLLEEVALRGQALVYLPGEHGERLGLQRIKVSGCPYACTQKVRLVARNGREIGWINKLF